MNEIIENEENKDVVSLQHERDIENKTPNRISSVFEQIQYEVSNRNSRVESQLIEMSQEKFDQVMALSNKNEDNQFAYHTKKMELEHELNIKIVETTNYNNQTDRQNGLYVLIFAAAITLGIFLKIPEYLSQWLSLMIGSAGGFGYGKYQGMKKNTEQIEFSSNKE